MGYLGDRPNGVPQIELRSWRHAGFRRDFDPGRVPPFYIETTTRFIAQGLADANSWFLTLT